MLKLAFGDSFEGHAEASEIGLPVDIGAGADVYRKAYLRGLGVSLKAVTESKL